MFNLDENFEVGQEIEIKVLKPNHKGRSFPIGKVLDSSVTAIFSNWKGKENGDKLYLQYDSVVRCTVEEIKEKNLNVKFTGEVIRTAEQELSRVGEAINKFKDNPGVFKFK